VHITERHVIDIYISRSSFETPVPWNELVN